MTYANIDLSRPNELTEDISQAFEGIRKNEAAFRDYLFVGGASGFTASQTGATAERPDVVLYSSGTERIRYTLTWGSSGGSDGNVTQAVIAYSANSGSTYDTIETRNPTYDSAGNCTGGAPMLLLTTFMGLPGKLKALTARVVALESGESVINDSAASTTTTYSSTKTDGRYLQLTGGTLSGAVTFSANAAIKTATHTVVTPAALAIDWTASHRQSKSVSSSPTFTFVAPAGPANLLIKVSNTHGSLSITPVWPAGVKWATTPPALAAGKTALYMLYYDGSVYWGSFMTGYTT